MGSGRACGQERVWDLGGVSYRSVKEKGRRTALNPSSCSRYTTVEKSSVRLSVPVRRGRCWLPCLSLPGFPGFFRLTSVLTITIMR